MLHSSHSAIVRCFGLGWSGKCKFDFDFLTNLSNFPDIFFKPGLLRVSNLDRDDLTWGKRKASGKIPLFYSIEYSWVSIFKIIFFLSVQKVYFLFFVHPIISPDVANVWNNILQRIPFTVYSNILTNWRVIYGSGDKRMGLQYLVWNIRCNHEVCTQTYSWGASARLLWTFAGPTTVHGWL